MANSFKYQDQILHVGDRVAVHQKITEEGKTRIQIFEGIILAVKGRNVNRTFTVRKIAAGSIGVERIYPVNSPNIDTLKLKASGSVRRAKLYYLRGRIGRQAIRVKEKLAAVTS